MSEPSRFDAETLLGVLERHGVQYVVVGGYAAQLHGSTRPTEDIDVVPATDMQNLTRLTAALEELGARIRTEAEPEGLPFRTSPEALRGLRMLNLLTAHGELDLAFTPSGTEGYAELERDARRVPVGALEVRIASLADVIRSKTAASRVKDLRALPELRMLAGERFDPAAPPATTASWTAADIAGPVYPQRPGDISPEQQDATRIASAHAETAANRAQREQGGGRNRPR